jgi:methionyl-tRNA formyltransferase
MLFKKYKLISYFFHTTKLSFKSNAANERPRVVFLGTDLLSKHILTSLNSLLVQNKIADLCVITSLQQNNKDNNSILNNKNKIIELCNQHNMKYYLWSDIKSNRQKYYDLFKTFDVGVVASFGHLIPSHFIQLFPL